MKKVDIIKELRRVATDLGKTSLSISDFREHSRVSLSKVRGTFGTWNAAVTEAGLDPIPPVTTKSARNPGPTEEQLLQEIIRVTKEVGKIPTHTTVRRFGAFSETPYRNRWGSLRDAAELAYEKYGWPLSPDARVESKAVSVQDKPEPRRVRKYIRQTRIQTAQVAPEPTKVKPEPTKVPPEPPQAKAKSIRPTKTQSVIDQPKQSTDRRRVQFGEPIDFRGVRFAPVNKQGVLHMFGMVSCELGFLIEAIRTEFPDCEAKRRMDTQGQTWEQVSIAFEYRSSAIREHGLSLDECDLIICWTHDWKDCPIEVLELRTQIASLPNR